VCWLGVLVKSVSTHNPWPGNGLAGWIDTIFICVPDAGSGSSGDQAPHGLNFLANGKHAPLLFDSARRGFSSMSQTLLVKLGVEYKLELAKLDLFDTVKTLVEFFLPDDPEETVYAAVSARMDEACGFQEMFESEECRDAFNEDDLKILDRFVDEEKEKHSGTYKQKCDTFGNTVASNIYKKHYCKPGSAKSNEKKISNGMRLYPSVVKAKKLTVDQALQFLPPGSLAVKDHQENRWRLKWSIYGRSRSWAHYGEVEAFAIAAKYLWASYTSAGGSVCPFGWIKDAADK
jgi:hypothetical protein